MSFHPINTIQSLMKTMNTSSLTMSSMDTTPKSHQHQNVASILSIGTATPPNCIDQTDFPDFFFRATKSEHLIDLKEKFTRMCDKSMIKKRYMYVTEDLLKEYPAIGTYNEPSLDIRQSILMKEVPKLGMEAAVKAVEEWNRPKSSLTHLIFVTSSGTTMPSADHELAKLMGLSPSIKRFMMYQQGCFAGAAALRLAKDIAENNANSRVLIVCSENTLCCFRAPHEDHLDVLVGSALFADGAAAVVVGAVEVMTGADPYERPLFQLLSAKQNIIPDSEDGIVAHVLEMGYAYYLSKRLPTYVGNNIVECFSESLGVTDRNSLFYVVHPGGPRVLDVVEDKLGLAKDKLETSRRVLSEYGNIWSASVFFVLDEMRKRSIEDGMVTTGQGKELGVLFALGPGVTVETIVLRSVATHVSV